MVYFVLLLAHLLICAVIFLTMKLGLLRVHRYMFFVALLLPFWGALVLLVLHYRICIGTGGMAEIGVEKLKLESELYRSVTVDDGRAASGVVPIEEALVVNSARERRAIIMDVLNDNPKEYINFLQKAGNNEDTEVVHYAVTAMVEISKENDYRLQDLERRHAADPENRELLCEYTDFLWNALCQGLMQGQVEVLNRETYSSLMQKKLDGGGTADDYARVVENELARKNHTLAAACLQRMKAEYGDAEQYYLSMIDYLAALGRGEEIGRLIEEMERKNVFISSRTREVLAFWKT